MVLWYEDMFENYADTYDRESFTHGTMGEVDFIEKEAGYNKSLKIWFSFKMCGWYDSCHF